jgi:hypothetical protein
MEYWSPRHAVVFGGRPTREAVLFHARFAETDHHDHMVYLQTIHTTLTRRQTFICNMRVASYIRGVNLRHNPQQSRSSSPSRRLSDALQSTQPPSNRVGCLRLPQPCRKPGPSRTPRRDSPWISGQGCRHERHPRFSIAVAQRNMTGLKAVLDDISNHASPRYGQWLTKDQVTTFTIHVPVVGLSSTALG